MHCKPVTRNACSFLHFTFKTETRRIRVKVAVIGRYSHGFLVDHKEAISRSVYPLPYKCRDDLFEIWRPYLGQTTKDDKDSEEPPRKKRSRKKARGSDLNEGEVEGIKYHNKVRDSIFIAAKSLISLGKDLGYFSLIHVAACNPPTSISDSSPDLSAMENRLVHRCSTEPIITSLGGGFYLLPSKTTFLMSDATGLQSLVDHVKSTSHFDLVVMDPPWYNKSAKRSGMYSFMSLWQIKSLPVPQLLSPGGLLAVWVTNKYKYIRFTREELMPFWSVDILAEWHWIKVTKTGELVVDLDSSHKKPYETLIIGRYNPVEARKYKLSTVTHSQERVKDLRATRAEVGNLSNETRVPQSQDDNDWSYVEQQKTSEEAGQSSEKEAGSCINDEHTVVLPHHSDDDQNIEGVSSDDWASTNDDTEDCAAKAVPGHQVICSIPCQMHSRKPPLGEILAEFLPPRPNCLEMFARNLTPGWTSWGNEVLKFQHIDNFKAVSPKPTV